MVVDVFLSYSRENGSFVQRLKKDIETNSCARRKPYSVWMDTAGIDGGVAWEKAIDNSIKACKIFCVVVSTASNESDWVRRETIRAEHLKKIRIPILLEDSELPLRLYDLQYVKFSEESYQMDLKKLLLLLDKILDNNKEEEEEEDGKKKSANTLPIVEAIPLTSSLSATAMPWEPTATATTTGTGATAPTSPTTSTDNTSPTTSTPCSMFMILQQQQRNLVPKWILQHYPGCDFGAPVESSKLSLILREAWNPITETLQRIAANQSTNHTAGSGGNCIANLNFITKEIADEIAKALGEEHKIYRFLNDQWLRSTGLPSNVCYYNFACLFSLLVEVELRLVWGFRTEATNNTTNNNNNNNNEQQQYSTTTNNGDLLSMAQAMENTPVEHLLKNKLLPLGNRSFGSIGMTNLHQSSTTTTPATTTTFGQFVHQQLQISKQCLEVAISAGWSNMEHVKSDPDLLALKTLLPS